jgi:hypothetical protein
VAGSRRAPTGPGSIILSSGVVTYIRVANGTYSLEVVKTPQGWRVKSLDLTLIDFVPFFGCS